MNVILYNGPGVSSLQTAIQRSLRELLASSYDILPVDAAVISRSPWEENTALLVMPGGRDLAFLQALSPIGINKISNYVRNGGKYLGICAGAYFACDHVVFEHLRPEYCVIGDRPLKFCPAVACGSVSPNFTYNSELGAQAMAIQLKDASMASKSEFSVYVNGGPYFNLKTGDQRRVDVIATYRETQLPAIVGCRVEKGFAVLSGPHLEVSTDTIGVTIESLRSSSHTEMQHLEKIHGMLEGSEGCRNELFKNILSRLGLTLDTTETQVLAPTPIQLCVETTDATKFRNALAATNNDTVVESISITTVEECCTSNDDSSPFSLSKYVQQRLALKTMEEHMFGFPAMYGRIVTSTQTILERNTTLRNQLPAGSVFICSHQLTGRGRGQNSWISQQGCLQFSFKMNHGEASSLVFIQYLFGLSVAKGIKALEGCEELPVKLKWPNDIYLVTPEGPRKIGGILITSEFMDGFFDLIVGCGLNVTNSRPTVCLQDFHKDTISHEKLLASIFSQFTRLYNLFVSDKVNSMYEFRFEPFLEDYYTHWLHQHQRVHIQEQGVQHEAVILGIHSSGLLRAYITEDGTERLLQPDGNSFDMIKGLIFAKK